MKNKAKTIIAFLIMGLALFIGIIAVIYGIKEQKEKAKQNFQRIYLGRTKNSQKWYVKTKK